MFRRVAMVVFSSFGFSVFIYSSICLIQSIKAVGNPLTNEFWRSYLELFDLPNQSFLLLWGGVIIAVTISLFIHRKRTSPSKTEGT